MSRSVNSAIAVLAVLSVAAMFVSSGETLLPVLKNTFLEEPLYALSYKNSIVFNLASGFLLSYVFWLLVVYFPERARRRIIRNNISRQYTLFKESVLRILLFAFPGNESPSPEALLDDKEFQKFFSGVGQKNWYAAMNHLQQNEEHLSELVLELEIFSGELAYVLNNTAIDDENVHRQFKQLRENVYRMQNSSLYTADQTKYVARFLWEILARWNFSTGYQTTDFIEDGIKNI